MSEPFVRQLAVQFACVARQSFEYTAYGMSLPWLSGGAWLMLHAINILGTSKNSSRQVAANLTR
jgi:hypothetical protein